MIWGQVHIGLIQPAKILQAIETPCALQACPFHLMSIAHELMMASKVFEAAPNSALEEVYDTRQR